MTMKCVTDNNRYKNIVLVSSRWANIESKFSHIFTWVVKFYGRKLEHFANLAKVNYRYGKFPYTKLTSRRKRLFERWGIYYYESIIMDQFFQKSGYLWQSFAVIVHLCVKKRNLGMFYICDPGVLRAQHLQRVTIFPKWSCSETEKERNKCKNAWI